MSAECDHISLLGHPTIAVEHVFSSIEINMVRSYTTVNFTQLVKTPTLFIDHSSTLRNHSFSNAPGNITDVSVPVYSITDHYSICITRRLLSNCSNGHVHKKITYMYMSIIMNISLSVILLNNHGKMFVNLI